MFLTIYYVPSPDHAYDSIQYIMNDVAFGWLIRGIHHWGASLMVIIVFCHMLRTFFSAAYKYPREFTWITGVVLFLVTLGMGFTGYSTALEPASILGHHSRHRDRRHGAIGRTFYHQRPARRDRSQRR